MQLQIHLLYEQFLIFCNLVLISFISSKPLVGENVRTANTNEYPFVVAIIASDTQNTNVLQNYQCTGSLLSREDVLTSEHCVKRKTTNGIYILVGTIDLNQGRKYYPAWWIDFSEWSIRTGKPIVYLENDIIIIRLTQEVSSRLTIGTLSLKPAKNFEKRQITIAGWGAVSNGSIPLYLQVVPAKILTKSVCEDKISRLDNEPMFLDKRYICTQARPYALIQDGDSGGPILFDNKIIGINGGNCPLPHLSFHPEKVNLHYSVEFYKYYILDIVNNY